MVQNADKVYKTIKKKLKKRGRHLIKNKATRQFYETISFGFSFFALAFIGHTIYIMAQGPPFIHLPIVSLISLPLGLICAALTLRSLIQSGPRTHYDLDTWHWKQGRKTFVFLTLTIAAAATLFITLPAYAYSKLVLSMLGSFSLYYISVLLVIISPSLFASNFLGNFASAGALAGFAFVPAIVLSGFSQIQSIRPSLRSE